ncbi:hypothetical protein AA0113_g2763 [Alternaria arborescens]|uniref:Uncharacterized protein n=1 Tax=Alternaria arborescens TaxID=156630 RepID=A0A4Q4SJN8_9PLEO|nr:hypothetical protein AA0111_g8292 [Alternaria arborescens]RYN82641.1 hypothetical protein AA0120_g9358 [Alternaria tenuissima]RYO26349.1 hypothetical protein AA0111_g8292 [Alternaria arborescens]RYO70731.1 hypothetical protein AA0113_g2763 [Alternaria arborescens]
MCETYTVEFACGCTDIHFKYTCQPHCPGSSMIKHKDPQPLSQKCDMHGGPSTDAHHYDYKYVKK